MNDSMAVKLILFAGSANQTSLLELQSSVYMDLRIQLIKQQTIQKSSMAYLVACFVDTKQKYHLGKNHRYCQILVNKRTARF